MTVYDADELAFALVSTYAKGAAAGESDDQVAPWMVALLQQIDQLGEGGGPLTLMSAIGIAASAVKLASAASGEPVDTVLERLHDLWSTSLMDRDLRGDND